MNRLKGGIEMKETIKVLIADSNRTQAIELRNQLKSWGYHVTPIASSISKTFAAVRKQNPDLVIMDVAIDADEGRAIDAAARFFHDHDKPVILLIDCMSQEVQSHLKLLRLFYCISKPLRYDLLHTVIEFAMLESETCETAQAPELTYETVNENLCLINA